jgi:hypothetical protein
MSRAGALRGMAFHPFRHAAPRRARFMPQAAGLDQ